VQNYTKTLLSAITEIVGGDNVRLLTVGAEPKRRPDGDAALGGMTKLRFLATSLWTALRWRPRLVICTHIGVAPAARAINKCSGIPYWIVLHGIEVWGELPRAKRLALQSADNLLAASRFTLSTAVSRHSLQAAHASVLPPAYSLAGNGAARADNNMRRPFLDPGRPTVLTVARLASSERYKGHDVMLEAWPLVLRRIPNASYLIVGDGDDRPRLEARAAEIGITGSVFFAGTVTGGELDACYEGCQVFAMPARTEIDSHPPRGEGFGIVFLEAMAHGKPVVGPSFGAPAEFIRPGEHGLLVNPVQPAEVAQALVELLREPERAQRMGDAARDWVASQFSYTVFCRRLREALSESSLS